MVDVLALIDTITKEDNEVVFIEQFVSDIRDFSSQYGSDISISYTAYNLAGKPSKYPDYGDYPQAFVMVRSCGSAFCHCTGLNNSNYFRIFPKLRILC